MIPMIKMSDEDKAFLESVNDFEQLFFDAIRLKAHQMPTRPKTTREQAEEAYWRAFEKLRRWME